MNIPDQEKSYSDLARDIKSWGQELGFQQVSISDVNLSTASERLKVWLEKNYHGDMDWMAAHGEKRYLPDRLMPGTVRVISARMDYLPDDNNMIAALKADDKAYIARYALGRDYHKLIRKRLSQLAERISNTLPEESQLRPFVDSAPVMEKPLAEKAGLGWLGKNTLLLNSEAGSWFFLGEIYINLPLPVDKPTQPDQCGKCQACLNICPTNAFPAPYVLDARRCISYLTIEFRGTIPVEFRKPMGNRIFGCDDCQIVCPWNRYAKATREKDFAPRHNLDNQELVRLFAWSEEEFLTHTAGSAIRRIGYECWLRNIAIGLGNAPTSSKVMEALESRRNSSSALVREHVEWALQQHREPTTGNTRKLKKARTGNT